jgi:predicted RNase H-like nuclease
MYIGVDGCKAGWIAVTKDANGLAYSLHAHMSDVVANYPLARLILVDIPIGLPSESCPTRPVDALARKAIGPRASSVFPAPTRSAVYSRSYSEACALNHQQTGRKISQQAWALCPRIAEVDELLLDDVDVRRRLHEIHPEVCFWAFNQGTPLAHGKHTAEGRQQRVGLLASHELDTPAFVTRVLAETHRFEVGADDVLDALAAYVTARLDQRGVDRLRGHPTHDDRGLPMEMLHATLQ